jgi:hypothetical protein
MSKQRICQCDLRAKAESPNTGFAPDIQRPRASKKSHGCAVFELADLFEEFHIGGRDFRNRFLLKVVHARECTPCGFKQSGWVLQGFNKRLRMRYRPRSAVLTPTAWWMLL